MGTPYRQSDSTDYYVDYFRTQRGGLPVFAGKSVMGGAGIGSVLSGLLRSATPLLKRGAVALGKRALTAASGTAADVIRGANVKTAAKRRLASVGKDLLGDVTAAMMPDSIKRAPRAASMLIGRKRRAPTKRRGNKRVKRAGRSLIL